LDWGKIEKIISERLLFIFSAVFFLPTIGLSVKNLKKRRRGDIIFFLEIGLVAF
jgi:hypothetical protein